MTVRLCEDTCPPPVRRNFALFSPHPINIEAALHTRLCSSSTRSTRLFEFGYWWQPHFPWPPPPPCFQRFGRRLPSVRWHFGIILPLLLPTTFSVGGFLAALQGQTIPVLFDPSPLYLVRKEFLQPAFLELCPYSPLILLSHPGFASTAFLFWSPLFFAQCSTPPCMLPSFSLQCGAVTIPCICKGKLFPGVTSLFQNNTGTGARATWRDLFSPFLNVWTQPPTPVMTAMGGPSSS